MLDRAPSRPVALRISGYFRVREATPTAASHLLGLSAAPPHCAPPSSSSGSFFGRDPFGPGEPRHPAWARVRARGWASKLPTNSLILHSALRFCSWEPRSHVTPVSFWSRAEAADEVWVPFSSDLLPPSHPCIGEIRLRRVGGRLPLRGCPPKPPFGAKFKGSKLGPALPRWSRRCGWRGSATGPGPG